MTEAIKPTIHMRKLCVGIDSLEQLQDWQELNLPLRGGKIWHVTRSWPKRAEELIKGGSLFWIIKGQMCVRQPIIGAEEHPAENVDEKPKCRILLGPELIPTVSWPHRPFQGWRYLKPEDAPPDLTEGQASDENLPAEMAKELRELGLL